MLAAELGSFVGAALRLCSAQALAANCFRLAGRLLPQITPMTRNYKIIKNLFAHFALFAAKAAPAFTAIQINTTKRECASAPLWQKFYRTSLQDR
jgi:hypothetical protein